MKTLFSSIELAKELQGTGVILAKQPIKDSIPYWYISLFVVRIFAVFVGLAYLIQASL
jgi:hypothetical protein